jgi:methyl-accepting chemotaxis protein
MQHSTIGQKVIGLAVVLVALQLLIGGITAYNLRGIDTSLATIAKDAIPGLTDIGHVSAHLHEFRSYGWQYVNETDASQKAELVRRMGAIRQDLEGDLIDYEKTVTQQDDRRSYDLLRQQVAAFFSAWNRIPQLHGSAQPEEAINLNRTAVTPAFDAANETLIRMRQWNADFGAHSASSADANVTSALVWIGLAVVVAVLLGSTLSYFIARKINTDLHGVVIALATQAEEIAGSAGQVAAISQTVALGATEQAASVEQTSAANLEITAMASQNAEKSALATTLVTDSQTRFAETDAALKKMLTAMEDIATANGRVNKIISLIDEIAFQTNILSLNAAVEAARAGEAGMGFAVVADEVRSLAQRCAQAAKDTESLIAESMAKSTEGKKRVANVMLAISGAADDAQKVKELVGDVKAASLEQSRGIQEVSKALGQIERVTQSSAASAEECAASAQDMSSRSSHLAMVVSTLRAMVESPAR